MLNQVVLVGRLVRDLQINKTEKGKKVGNMTLAIPRSFKNMDGVYDTDFVDCIVWENIAQNTADYCHKGDIIGIKGRIQTSSHKKEDGTTKYNVDVVAEKVTFLSNNPNKIRESEE